MVMSIKFVASQLLFTHTAIVAATVAVTVPVVAVMEHTRVDRTYPDID